jgi:hypothetical protein
MSVVLITSDYSRQTMDELNQYICMTEYRCFVCKKWVDEEDIVWIDPQTLKITTKDMGKPYHIKCTPNQNGGNKL